MKRLSFVMGSLVLAVAALAAAPPPRQAAPPQVYVSVVSPDGKPVAGLGSDAFHVREDGTDRRVEHAEPATDPLDLAIVAYTVGNYQTESADVRKTIAGVIDAVRRANAHARVALAVSLVTPQFLDVSTSASALQKSLDTFFMTPDGFSLFEAIDTVCRLMQREPGHRRAILVLGNAAGVGEPGEARQVAQALEGAGASLWFLQYRLGYPRTEELVVEPRSDPEIDKLISSWTLASGGDNNTIVSTTALHDAAQQMADALLSEYVVTYARPTGAAPKTLQVGVAAPPGTRILAPHWAPK